MEELILQQVNKAIGEAIKTELIGYNKPLSKLTEKVIDNNSDKLYSLINDEFSGLLDSKDFKIALQEALNQKLAKVLINRMGGELEKQVNELKQNPQSRAKITLAIDKVIEELK
jgi:hypothetical protein